MEVIQNSNILQKESPANVYAGLNHVALKENGQTKASSSFFHPQMNTAREGV